MLNDESILSIEACQIRAASQAGPHELFNASHKWATRGDFTKKGNLARSQIPFEYCDGAEGGI